MRTKEFKKELENLLNPEKSKLWLASSNGYRLDVEFGVGENQSLPIKLVDHMEGFYLLGEGVPVKKLSKIHKLFKEYCKNHKAVDFDKALPLSLEFKTHHEEHHRSHQMVMHYPFAPKT